MCFRTKDKERDIKHLLTSNYLEATELDQGTEDPHIPLFDLNTIAVATGNFSDDNKLGEGGFGPVYKVIFFHYTLLYSSVHIFITLIVVFKLSITSCLLLHIRIANALLYV